MCCLLRSPLWHGLRECSTRDVLHVQEFAGEGGAHPLSRSSGQVWAAHGASGPPWTEVTQRQNRTSPHPHRFTEFTELNV